MDDVTLFLESLRRSSKREGGAILRLRTPLCTAHSVLGTLGVEALRTTEAI